MYLLDKEARSASAAISHAPAVSNQDVLPLDGGVEDELSSNSGEDGLANNVNDDAGEDVVNNHEEIGDDKQVAENLSSLECEDEDENEQKRRKLEKKERKRLKKEKKRRKEEKRKRREMEAES